MRLIMNLCDTELKPKNCSTCPLPCKIGDGHSSICISQPDTNIRVKPHLLRKKPQPLNKPRPLKNRSVTAPVKTVSTEKVEPEISSAVYSTKCKNCENGVIEYNSVIGQNYCNSCCIVDESINLVNYELNATSIAPNVGVNLNIKKPPVAIGSVSNKRKAAGHRQCLKKIELIATEYSFGSERVKIVKTMFSSLYPSIKTKSIRFKETVAGCCIYKELNNCKVPVLLSELLKVVGCRQKDFHKALQLVETKFGKNSVMEEHDQIRAILKDASHADFEGENLCKLIKKTEDILELAKRCWLSTGRSTTALIIASAYLAYKALLIRFEDRQWEEINFESFCKKFNITAQCNTASNRVRELKSLFLKLGPSNLNSMYDGTKILKKEIYLHIDDILMFRDEILEEYVNLHRKTPEGNEVATFTEFRNKRKVPVCPQVKGMTDREAKFLNRLPDDELIGDREMQDYIRSPIEVKQTKLFKLMPDKPMLDKDLKSHLYRNLPGYKNEARRQEFDDDALMTSSSENKDSSSTQKFD